MRADPIMLTRRMVLSLVVAVVAFAGGHAARAAAGAPDAFIRDIGKEAINSLTGKNLSDTERRNRFRSILSRAFDMPVIARSTLGVYWRRTTPEQRREYVKLFEDFVVQAYAERFRDYSGEEFKVGQTRDLNNREHLVGSEIVRGDQPPVRVQWRVRGNSDYKIVDVIVEGISMLVTHRDEFAAVIQQNGGKVDGLLDDLRRKTASVK
jgi:phospholipid transport system substrate-binding protein